MMVILSALMTLTGAVPALEMQSIVAARLHALDRIELDVFWQPFVVPADIDPFEPGNWTQPGPEEGMHCKIVRPGVLLEVLPQYTRNRGAIYSIWNHRTVMTCRALDPQSGRRYFESHKGAEAQFLGAVPLLQVLDIHLNKAPEPQTTLADLLGFSNISAAEAPGGTRYSIGLPLNDGAWTCDFVLDQGGMPLSIYSQTMRDFRTNPYTWEERTLSTTCFEGIDVPSRLVLANRNVDVVPTTAVFVFNITNVRRNESLTEADVIVEPALQNATVWTESSSGHIVGRIYDPQGNMQAETQFAAGGAGQPSGAERGRFAWLHAVPYVAAAFATLSTATLFFVLRKRTYPRC